MKRLKRKNQPPKNKGGRPKGSTGASKYTPKFIEKERVALEKWAKDKKNFWIGEFAVERGYYRQKMSEFAEESEVFSETLKTVKQIQENRLVMLTLAGKTNPAMSIFALKNVAGWRDKKEMEVEASEDLKKILEKVREILPK